VTICLALNLAGALSYPPPNTGDHIIESVITRRSAEEMALKKGDAVTAVVKATEVMLSKG
jgi:hypothetical protein